MTLWVVFGKPNNIEEFLEFWAEKYKNKFGNLPNRCHIHPSYTKIEQKIGQILIIYDKYVPISTFWFCEEKR